MPTADFCIINTDDERLKSLVPHIKGDVVTYGVNGNADYRAEIIGENKGSFARPVIFFISFKCLCS